MMKSERLNDQSEMTASNSPANGGGSTHAYGEAWYWDNRYSVDPSTFDWYQKYPSLAPLLRMYIPHRSSPILVVGSGNSAFSEGMVNDEYDEVVNVDISSVVIEAMQKKYSNYPQLKYMTMDVRDMSAFDSNTFDAVIDKGTLDSLLCGPDARENATKMLGEVSRVLKDQGVYILITYGSPTYRLPLLKGLHSWTIKLHIIDKHQPGKTSDHLTRDLTSPVPLDMDGDSSASVTGQNTDMHYIYVCQKDTSGNGET